MTIDVQIDSAMNPLRIWFAPTADGTRIAIPIARFAQSEMGDRLTFTQRSAKTYLRRPDRIIKKQGGFFIREYFLLPCALLITRILV